MAQPTNVDQVKVVDSVVQVFRTLTDFLSNCFFTYRDKEWKSMPRPGNSLSAVSWGDRSTPLCIGFLVRSLVLPGGRVNLIPVTPS